jgi:DNA-binding NarL/FixJ family response regulator
MARAVPTPLPAVPAAAAADGPYRFLLGDDHPFVRVGVRHILAENFPDAEIAEAANAADILAAVERDPWDVVFLDLSLPDRSGIDLLPELKRLRPQLRVLILTIADEAQMGVRLMRAGVAGYLTKETIPSDLVTAVRQVLAGGKYVSPRLAEQLAHALDASATQAPHDTLSQREFQVVRLLAAGHTASEIAALLGLDVRTIGTFRRNILRKLQLHTTQQIIYYAYRHGLVS